VNARDLCGPCRDFHARAAGAGGPGAVAAGPGGPGGAPARGGAFGRGARAPAQPPVVLSRNGKEYTLTGTNVRARTEINVIGSWVIFDLPEFSTAASGAPQENLDALRKASDTSYFKDNAALWVKVVSSGDTGAPAPLVVEAASKSAAKRNPAA